MAVEVEQSLAGNLWGICRTSLYKAYPGKRVALPGWTYSSLATRGTTMKGASNSIAEHKTDISKHGKTEFNAMTYNPKKFPSHPWEEHRDLNGWEPYSPQYLVCERTDGELFTSSKAQFFINNLEDKFRELASFSKMRSGAILIQTASPAQSWALLTCDRLADILVSIMPHKSLNMVQGLIYHGDLLSQTDEELRANLHGQGVHFIQWVYRGPKDNRVASGAFILAFEGDMLPEKASVM